MCLAIPARLVSVRGGDGEVQWGDESEGAIRRKISLDLVEGVGVGDYVLVHAGFAIHKLDEEQARAGLETWREMLDNERKIPS